MSTLIVLNLSMYGVQTSSFSPNTTNSDVVLDNSSGNDGELAKVFCSGIFGMDPHVWKIVLFRSIDMSVLSDVSGDADDELIGERVLLHGVEFHENQRCEIRVLGDSGRVSDTLVLRKHAPVGSRPNTVSVHADKEQQEELVGVADTRNVLIHLDSFDVDREGFHDKRRRSVGVL